MTDDELRRIGMVRCDECARTVTLMRTASNGDSERKYQTIGCGVDRTAIVPHRWRRCDEYRAKARGRQR